MKKWILSLAFIASVPFTSPPEPEVQAIVAPPILRLTINEQRKYAFHAEQTYRIPKGLLLILCREETNGFIRDMGAAGEYGICQPRITTWQDFKCWDYPENPAANYLCAAKILAARKRACRDWEHAVASYNQGTNVCPPRKGRFSNYRYAVMDSWRRWRMKEKRKR